jgi:hypothetical protein
MGVKKESSRLWEKECGTGCDGSVCAVGIERGGGVPSKTRKPAMTPSEASVRLSSRAYFALSLFTWRLRLGPRVSLFKIAHFSKQRHGGFGGCPLPSFTKLGTGWDCFAVNLGGANSELRIIVGKGDDSETLLTSGIVSGV